MMIDLTRNELMEISDAITHELDHHLDSGDPERLEQKYGTLTLLHEAQSKILPVAFNFRIEDTDWGSRRAQRIAELRVLQGLPEIPTAAERSRWR